MGLVLTTTAFEAQDAIPTRYTADGDDVSPALSWSEDPPERASWVLLMEDPDAPQGTFTHWLVYDLPGDVHELPEAVPATERLVGGAGQGRNDFGTLGYRGPCPPAGTAHRYRFVLSALDTPLLGLRAGSSRAEVLSAMEGHVVGQAELLGTYGRRTG
jgi:Raf kinase inhibitor-like YbhB/YbcL family protein